MGGYWIDILAVGFFVLEWTVYAVTLEHTAYGRDSLSARMHGYREIWIRPARPVWSTCRSWRRCKTAPRS